MIIPLLKYASFSFLIWVDFYVTMVTGDAGLERKVSQQQIKEVTNESGEMLDSDLTKHQLTTERKATADIMEGN